MKNLSFRKKIEYISILISLIPVILLGALSYSQTRQILIERENSSLEESLMQETSRLDYMLSTCTASAEYIIWNENFRDSLSKEYSSNYDMYYEYTEVIDPLFLSVKNLNSIITSVTLYTDIDIYPHGDVLRPLEDISALSWYEDALNTWGGFFYCEEASETLLLIYHMYDKNNTNIFVLSLDMNELFQNVTSLMDDAYGIAFLDKSGQIIQTWNSFSDKKYILDASSLATVLNSQESVKGYLTKTSSVDSAGWYIILYKPTFSVTAISGQILIPVILIILLSLFLIFVATRYLSRWVVRPVMELVENIHAVEKGSLEVTVEQRSNDEIGTLVGAFQKMVIQLKHLIQDDLENQIKRQEYEMKALQAQINPHFLYNSLSLINSRAILAGQEDISQMALLLSTFYRTTLNKGNSLTTVQSELENTLSYARIQKLLHSNSFEIICDIEEAVYPYTVPNLLLQPLVENAITHGLDHKSSPDTGVLTISASKEGENLIFKVSDNGCGMDASVCQSILTHESHGYGVKNVNQRIRLFCGEKYGISYKSTPGAGTCATIVLLAKL